MPALWTLGEVAEMLNVPEHRIQYLFRSRKIPDVQRIGGRRVFTQEDVRRAAEALGVPCPRTRAKKENKRR